MFPEISELGAEDCESGEPASELTNSKRRKINMADDPNKKHVDGWFVSSQSYEYDYFKSTIKQAFPLKSDDAVAGAILSCRKSIAPSEGRKKLTECVHKKLSG
jgi:hypothetical protein